MKTKKQKKQKGGSYNFSYSHTIGLLFLLGILLFGVIYQKNMNIINHNQNEANNPTSYDPNVN